MTQPIQQPAPVNPIITIQPVTTAIPNRESGAAPNPLANLASGTTIEGFVVNRDAQNNPILRTAIGDLRVSSEVFLKTGSEVVFKVDANQASLARIISVDGLTPQDYSSKNTHGITRDTVSTSLLQPTTGNAQAPVAGKVPAPAPVLQALILQGHPPESPVGAALKAAQTAPAPLLTQLSQLRAGTPIRLSVLDVKLPPLPIALSAVSPTHTLDALLPAPPRALPATASPAPASTSAPTPTLNASAAPATPAPATATPSAPQPASNATPTVAATMPNEIAALQTNMQERNAFTATLRATPSADQLLHQSTQRAQYGKSSVASVPLYASPPLNVQAREPASTHSVPLNATVIGHEADGANILHTPFATVKLYTPQPLPTGSTLVVQAAIDEPTLAPAAPPSASPTERFVASSAAPFQSLDDALQWLIQQNPDIAQEAIQRLPAMNHKLTSNMLFVMAAITQGDVTQIIGKRATRLLELSAPQLLSKLRMDIGKLQADTLDSPLTHWTMTPLPMLLGQEIQHARLYLSKEPPNDDTAAPEKAERGQRFVLEVGMTQLGEMQLDGFVKTAQKHKNFDLIIRSAQPLEPSVIQGISAIFNNSMNITGMRGQLAFQSGAQHFFKPAADIKPAPDASTANTILA